MIQAKIAPFGYYGSKSRHLEFIDKHLPKPNTFIDVFGGSGVVAISQHLNFKKIIYNDIHDRLFNFFTILRDDSKNLIDTINLTPASRKELQFCYEKSTCPLEDARRVFVLLNQSFANDGINKNKPRWQTPSATNLARRFHNRKQLLPVIADILKNLNIENKDYEALIRKYDNQNVVFFCDPPYDLAARRGAQYLHEFGKKDHINLKNILVRCKAKAVVCGFHSDLYDNLYQGWHCYENTVNCNNASGAKGYAGHETKRTECLWVKPS